MSLNARGVPGISKFTGEVVYAAKQSGVDCILNDTQHMEYQVNDMGRVQRTSWVILTWKS